MPERKPTLPKYNPVDRPKRYYVNIDPSTGEKIEDPVYRNGDLRYEAVLVLVDISSNKNTYFKLQLLNNPSIGSAR